MTTRTDELHEARRIVAALERMEPMNDGDRRFVESWRGYLNRTGDDAAIGRWRLQQLRKVAASYGIGQADEPNRGRFRAALGSYGENAMDLADERLKAALAKLLPRDRRILLMRSEGRTFDEIGATFEISRAQAFRWAQTARRKLDAKLKAGARGDNRAVVEPKQTSGETRKT